MYEDKFYDDLQAEFASLQDQSPANLESFVLPVDQSPTLTPEEISAKEIQIKDENNETSKEENMNTRKIAEEVNVMKIAKSYSILASIPSISSSEELGAEENGTNVGRELKSMTSERSAQENSLVELTNIKAEEESTDDDMNHEEMFVEDEIDYADSPDVMDLDIDCQDTENLLAPDEDTRSTVSMPRFETNQNPEISTGIPLKTVFLHFQWNQCIKHCHICRKQFYTRTQLSRHLKKHHGMRKANAPSHVEGDIHNQHSCLICKRVFRFEYDSIRNHLRSAHKCSVRMYESWFCKQLEKVFASMEPIEHKE